MDYLQPDLIVETIDRGGSPAELKTLLLNYEGLTGNSQLSAIWITDGFRQTHRLLRQWVETTPMVDELNRSAKPAMNENEFGKSIYEDPYADADRDVKTLPTPPAKTPQETDL
jgi:hypothetical protein